MSEQTAILAGGCFWCLEPVFSQLQGVKRVISGYIGGQTLNPTYKQVCNGDTGHAEAIRIDYDPEQIAFEALLEIFFVAHDPTTPNRQGHDIGTQYRSAVFCQNETQRQAVQDMIVRLDQQRLWPDPIVTQINGADTFYPAEDYHQYYYINNQRQPYCMAVARPKIDKVRAHYAARIKDDIGY
ncbi:peptide-methionine (S)-S-oxide reductase MsrA [Methylobacillus flagellatus]|uniref:peptide-methionine (S)-S-oxide reductase MsrA n=1 Tax=Methylobacillus flagellatus TaxID=405 RepID=UPI0010F68D19|nr:peptide-methionine (S)-S-oxide reductase MsrA [Methylobacillus flagellatus]